MVAIKSSKIEEKLKNLPDQPGIYRFISKRGQIIYIGKAKNLRKRVRGYFVLSQRPDSRTAFLLPNIFDVEWIVTHTESEALILEDFLIKTHKPRYNIRLKDDKTYPYFKLSLGELYPRLTLVREIEKDGSEYFGPYVAAGKARETWKVIKKHFPLRQSKMKLDGSKTYQPCLNYQMKRCLAPCAGFISSTDYGVIVGNVRQLLRGDYHELMDSLKKRMNRLSDETRYEEAGIVRNQIEDIRHTLQRQHVVSKNKVDRDVFGLKRLAGFSGVQVLFIRRGILLSDDFFLIKQSDAYDNQELIRSALSKLYISGNRPIPDEILLPFDYTDSTMLEEYCATHRRGKINVIHPKRGERKALLDLANKNAVFNLSREMNKARMDTLIIEEVQKRLKLNHLPRRVECFDISNISGTNTVASMVVWEDNKPVRSEYRKYRIKSVSGANDFAAMEEVLGRRYRRLLNENQPLPDLILIDGGKGQLSMACKILKLLDVDLTAVDVVALAKGKSERRSRGEMENDNYEYIVKPNRKNPIQLKKNSSTLFFVQNIRDEAHRFAVQYHRKLRSKNGLRSELEAIPGIGPQKRKRLLKEFSSIERIRQSDETRLSSLKGISRRDAVAILDHLNRDESHTLA